MANKPNQGMGMRMNMSGGLSGIPDQQMRIAPPVATTVEDALAYNLESQRTILGEDALADLGNYLGTQDHQRPYTDAQVTQHMRSLGYEFTRREAALGRVILKSRERHSD